MPQKAVVDAVEARLFERWDACPVFGINLQGEPPQDGSVFAQVQYPTGSVRQMDLAASYYREEGTIRLIVNAQRGFGVQDGLELLDRLAALFRSKKFGGVQTFSPSVPVIDDRNDDGLYFPISVSVEYQFDFRDTTGFYA